MTKDKLPGNWITRLFTPTARETTYLRNGEILIVFVIGFLIALSLWLLVNLGREYTVTMQIPLNVEGYSEEMAFAELPPDEAEIGVSGEGWSLISLYRNPPEISVPYDQSSVDISEMVQDHLISYPDLVVQKVSPSVIEINMQPKSEKRVPVKPFIDVSPGNRFEVVGGVRVDPDSVTVTGAASVVDTIESWPTVELRLENIKSRVEESIELADSRRLVTKDTTRVTISLDVSEFTEGEVRVNVRLQNAPDDQQIRFSPSVLTVRYRVPLEQFGEAREIIPFEALVTYNDILEDTTGTLLPRVVPTTDDLDLRLLAVQPEVVSYFRVIGD